MKFVSSVCLKEGFTLMRLLRTFLDRADALFTRQRVYASCPFIIECTVETAAWGVAR